MASNKKPGTHHVVPNSEGGWDVKRGGALRSSGHFDTKQAAVDRGREISRNAPVAIVNLEFGMRIAQSDSHGNDPRNIKG